MSIRIMHGAVDMNVDRLKIEKALNVSFYCRIAVAGKV